MPTNERQPFFERFGWTQRIPYYCNCGDNRYDSLQAKLAGRPASGLWLLAHYTLARARQDGPEQFFHDRELQRGRPDWARTHRFVLASTYELPFGRGKRFLADASTGLDRLVGGWQLNANATIQSGLPFEVTYREAFLDRDVGPNRPDLIGDPEAGGGTRDRWFNATPIGSPGSAFARPAVGTFGDLPRNAPDGTGLLAGRRVAVQEGRAHEEGRAGAARGGGQPLQPREPRAPRQRGRRSRKRQPQRGPHQLNRELQPGSPEEPPVRRAAQLLSAARRTHFSPSTR